MTGESLEVDTIDGSICVRVDKRGMWYRVTSQAPNVTALRVKRIGLAARVAYELDGTPFEHRLLVLPGGPIRVGPRMRAG